MTAVQKHKAIKTIIADSTNRCENYCPPWDTDGEPCDGLQGCDNCLDIVTEAIMDEIA